MLSQREWQFAKSENFMFTVPVQVAWESLDSSMISRLFVRRPHLGLSHPNPNPNPNPKPKPNPKPDLVRAVDDVDDGVGVLVVAPPVGPDARLR